MGIGMLVHRIEKKAHFKCEKLNNKNFALLVMGMLYFLVKKIKLYQKIIKSEKTELGMHTPIL